MEAALRHFEAQGIELLDQKPRKMENGDLIAFINPKSTNGILIELVEMGAE